MILLGTHATGALVYYLREGSFTHADCDESAQVQVSVRITGVDELSIESDESWTCEACGLKDTSHAPAVHATLADALRRLPPPPPGELDVDDLAAQMLVDITHTRAEDALRVQAEPGPTLDSVNHQEGRRTVAHLNSQRMDNA